LRKGDEKIPPVEQGGRPLGGQGGHAGQEGHAGQGDHAGKGGTMGQGSKRMNVMGMGATGQILPIRLFRLLLVILALTLFAGCSPPAQTVIGQRADLRSESDQPSRLTCFLVLKDSEGPAIRMEVTAIEVLADGLWLPIADGPVQLDSTAIGEGQLFLGGRAVPPGAYHRLRLTVNNGTLRQADGAYAVITSESVRLEVSLPEPLVLNRDESRILLLTWNVQESLGPGNILRPALEVSPQLRQLPVNLVYVACPDIDTIFLVRADHNWVVEAFGLKGGPTYLYLDPNPARQRLYVLAAHEATVKVVDLSSHRVVDFFPVPLNDAPTYMTISPDGRWAYLLDEHSGYLSRMDLGTGRIAARVRLGFRPQHAAYLESLNLLAVSLLSSNKVVLLDPLSLGVVRSFATGSAPRGLFANATQLYITEGGDNMVSVVDLAAQRTLSRIAVGLKPHRLMEADNVLYVSNYDSGSLSVLMPGQLGVIREVQGLGRPMEMVFDHFYRRLYVGENEAAALAVIDVNSNLLVGRVFLGARPAGMTIIQ
jgi:DNA-binding beta-propeller fold protein YncE